MFGLQITPILPNADAFFYIEQTQILQKNERIRIHSPSPSGKKQAANASAAVPGNIMAAISAAVTVVTQGKGKVAKVEKL